MPKTVPTKLPPNYLFRLMPLRNWLSRQADHLGNWVQENWFRLLIIALLTLILLRKDVSLQLNLQNGNQAQSNAMWVQPGSYSPLAAVEEEVVTKAPVLNAKKERQRAYVERFADVAKQEMNRFGIPASITLGQGLLETNAGQSPLATTNNNHFGLKCFSRNCTKGHCSNFSDDSHKDFFRIFASAWESFRAHSLLLVNGERYQPLFRLPKTDYKGWAKGLGNAGYATDKEYARKLVRLIEELELDEYDS